MQSNQINAIHLEIMKRTIQHMANEAGIGFDACLDEVFVKKTPNAVRRYNGYMAVVANEAMKSFEAQREVAA